HIMQRMFSLGIIFLILFLVDLYVFQAVKMASQALTPTTQKILHILYWSVFAITITTILLATNTSRSGVSPGKMYLASTLFGIFASKLVVILFLFTDDAIRIGKIVWNTASSDTP